MKQICILVTLAGIGSGFIGVGAYQTEPQRYAFFLGVGAFFWIGVGLLLGDMVLDTSEIRWTVPPPVPTCGVTCYPGIA